MKLTIDDHEIQVELGTTILEAARAHAIPIPTLCYHEVLEPYAACRLCIVELASARGKLVAACAYECEEGLVVQTNSTKVQQARRNTAELLLAGGAHLPAVRALAATFGVNEVRAALPQDDCILCGLCVRACAELVGAHAISLIGRGLAKKVGVAFNIASSACIGCATCVLICPTGAIRLADVTPTPVLQTGDHPNPPHDPRTCHVCGVMGPTPSFYRIDAEQLEVHSQ